MKNYYHTLALMFLCSMSSASYATSERNSVNVEGIIINTSNSDIKLISGKRADANFPSSIKKTDTKVNYGISLPANGEWTAPVIYETNDKQRCYFQFRINRADGNVNTAVISAPLTNNTTSLISCHAAGSMLKIAINQ